MYLISPALLPEICKDCKFKTYDSGFVGAGMPSEPSGYGCLKGRIMPTKSNKCKLKLVQDIKAEKAQADAEVT